MTESDELLICESPVYLHTHLTTFPPFVMNCTILCRPMHADIQANKKNITDPLWTVIIAISSMSHQSLFVASDLLFLNF